MDITVSENGIHLYLEVSDDGDIRLLHLAAGEPRRMPDEESKKKYRLLEVQETGMNQNDHHGSKHTGTAPGSLFRYSTCRDYRNGYGRKLEIDQQCGGLWATSHLQFFDGTHVIKTWTSLSNQSNEIHPLEYISSFALTGLSKDSDLPRDTGARIYLPHNTWYGEAQWKSYSPHELGYDAVNNFSVKKIALSSTGTWPASQFLPMGSYENHSAGQTVTWQIETAGSWNWEISDIADQLYLQISGPSYQENQFVKKLKPGETFQTVPCAVAFVNGNFEKSIQELTKYRRVIRRKNKDNEHPHVIFNDYMNCLTGDPTTEKLLPLIDAAQKAGCKYFCIDCGWYDDGPWWDGVGEWLPSKARFPGGILEPLEYIRKKGMIPGLWLELEVMGIHCPLASKVPKDWFFQRNGRVIIDEGRYQLDYRNPEVIAHANRVIDRLVNEYRVGYIKMDYNINAGTGTERDADSAGEGLLQHTRAYLDWLDGVFARYPDLIIENCGSGGMRMEYSLLSRHSIQSVTDQTDYLKMAAIAANCATAAAPEQAAIWSYPLREGDCEETIFNMVNAILLRIHQSGHLAELSPERFAYVQEGIAYHHSISERLNQGFPFWPLGLASMSNEFSSFGMDCGDTLYLAVWHVRGKQNSVRIPLTPAEGKDFDGKCAYPSSLPANFSWNNDRAELTVALQPKTARVFEFHLVNP